MKKTPAAEIVARFSTPGKYYVVRKLGYQGPKEEALGRKKKARGVLLAVGVGSSIIFTPELMSALRWSNPAMVGKPRSTDPLGRGFFQGGENTLMPVDPGECRQHALDCVRMAQTATSPEARKIWSDLARTWLRFATDLEASQCLLDEWGRPKAKKHQNE